MRQFTIESSAGSLVFNSGTPDGDGAYFSGQLDGWDGSDVRISLGDRTGSIGQFVSDAHVGARTLTVKQGIVAAPDERTRTVVRDRINAVLMTMASVDGIGTLSVDEWTPDGLRTLTVPIMLNAKPQLIEFEPMPVTLQGLPLGFYWPLQITLVLLAPDPLKIGTDNFWHPADGVTHVETAPGTAPAMPIITLHTLSTDVNLNHSELGRTVLLSSATMPAVVVIDLAAKTIVDGGGNNRFDIVTSPPSQWWPIMPGANTITIAGIDAGSVVHYSPAWW